MKPSKSSNLPPNKTRNSLSTNSEEDKLFIDMSTNDTTLNTLTTTQTNETLGTTTDTTTTNNSGFFENRLGQIIDEGQYQNSTVGQSLITVANNEAYFSDEELPEIPSSLRNKKREQSQEVRFSMPINSRLPFTATEIHYPPTVKKTNYS